MKKTLPILLVFVLLLSGCGGDPDPKFSTPEKTLEEIARAVHGNSYSDYRECFSENFLDDLTRKGFDEFSAAWSTKYEILNSAIVSDGEEAVLMVRMYYNSGYEVNERDNGVFKFEFMHENGEWKALIPIWEEMPG